MTLPRKRDSYEEYRVDICDPEWREYGYFATWALALAKAREAAALRKARTRVVKEKTMTVFSAAEGAEP